MHIISSILLLITEGIPSLVNGDMEWILSITMLNLQCIILLSLVLKPPKKTNIIARSLILVFLIYRIIDFSLNSVYHYFDYNIYLQSYQLTAGVCFIIFIYNLLKPYNHKNDPIKELNNVYLCFWRPKNIISLSGSLLGKSLGGVSIYSGGFLYGYRWNSTQYQKEPISKELIARNFVVFDTGILINEVIHKSLTNLVNFAHAGRLRIRCISTIKPVLEILGPRYKPNSIFEYIPSIYSARIMNR